MKKIIKPALLEKKTGKVDLAPSVTYSHEETEKKLKIKDKEVERGFIDSEGKFEGRQEAAKTAKKAGEVKKPGKKLHSHELRKALKVKKAPK